MNAMVNVWKDVGFKMGVTLIDIEEDGRSLFKDLRNIGLLER